MTRHDTTAVREDQRFHDSSASSASASVAAVTVCARTLRLKVKRESYAWLNIAAMEVNTVWNWAAQESEKAARPCAGARKWLTGFDLNNLSAGARWGIGGYAYQ